MILVHINKNGDIIVITQSVVFFERKQDIFSKSLDNSNSTTPDESHQVP